MNLALLSAVDPHSLRRARKQLRRFTHEAPKQAAKFAGQGRALVDTSAEMVRAHPVAAAGLLLGIGIVAGALATVALRR